MKLLGRFLVAGTAEGLVFATTPLSFWGGVDPVTGRVVDRSHPAVGRSIAGTILVIPAGRGSSSSSTVLAEAIRLGTAPAAIVCSEPDPILVIGGLVAERLYQRTCPIVVLSAPDHAALAQAESAAISLDGDDNTAVILGA